MKQTTNYQLSQWDPGDRILRTDFNGDNGKIDAAIKATETAAKDAVATLTSKVTAVEEKSGLKLLKTVTTTDNSNLVTVYLSDIRWEQWSAIHLLVDPFSTNGSPIALYLNGLPENALGSMPGNTQFHYNFAHILFYPLLSRTSGATGITMISSGSGAFSFPFTFKDIAYIQLAAAQSSSVLVGSKLTIWGEK